MTWLAASNTTDLRELARRVERARIALYEEQTPVEGLRGPIARSWRRCRPQELRPVPAIVSAEAAAERWEASPLHAARPLLQMIEADVARLGGQLLIVTDADALILRVAGNPAALSAGESVGAMTGANWHEERVGTNAMGTALAEDHPVQVFGPEHLNMDADSWVCSAAVVHDPETREQLGTIDVSAARADTHPHSLTLVRMLANQIESLLGGEAAARRARLAKDWGEPVLSGRARALVAANGVVVLAHSTSMQGTRVTVPPDGGPVTLDGRRLHAEPLADGGYLLWPDRAGAARASADSLAVTALGRNRATLTLRGEEIELSRRHSEIIVLLTRCPEGVSDEQLALEIYGEEGKPVTARAEISRLRRRIGPLLQTAPYRLCGDVRTDFDEVEALVHRGAVAEALARYPGPLLPASEAPVVAECRDTLEFMARHAVLESGDVAVLERWVQHPSGRDDTQVYEALLDAMEDDDPRRAVVLGHLRRLRAAVAAVAF